MGPHVGAGRPYAHWQACSSSGLCSSSTKAQKCKFVPLHAVAQCARAYFCQIHAAAHSAREKSSAGTCLLAGRDGRGGGAGTHLRMRTIIVRSTGKTQRKHSVLVSVPVPGQQTARQPYARRAVAAVHMKHQPSLSCHISNEEAPPQRPSPRRAGGAGEGGGAQGAAIFSGKTHSYIWAPFPRQTCKTTFLISISDST